MLHRDFRPGTPAPGRATTGLAASISTARSSEGSRTAATTRATGGSARMDAGDERAGSARSEHECATPRRRTSRPPMLTRGASERSHWETSTASTIRPSVALGSGSDASVRRIRSGSTRLRLSASYIAPYPRSMRGHQGQIDQRPDRPVSAQHAPVSQATPPPARSTTCRTSAGSSQDHPVGPRCHPALHYGHAQHRPSRPPLSSSSSARGTRRGSSGVMPCPGDTPNTRAHRPRPDHPRSKIKLSAKIGSCPAGAGGGSSSRLVGRRRRTSGPGLPPVA